MTDQKRIPRSERYKRQIRALREAMCKLTHTLRTVAPELSPERQEQISAALSAVATPTKNDNSDSPSRSVAGGLSSNFGLANQEFSK
jgi:hypothetical protein